MFRVTPVPENSKERKVSFSPDIDESYRHQVVDKIKTLMDEVSIIHEKEEKTLKKLQDNDSWEFKQKQELELQAFLKKQREQAASFKNNQTNQWNDLKERHTQETWKLFGAKAPASSRPSLTNIWADQGQGRTGSNQSSRNSPWSPHSTSNAPSPSWPRQTQNPWTPSNGDKEKEKGGQMTNYWNS